MTGKADPPISVGRVNGLWFARATRADGHLVETTSKDPRDAIERVRRSLSMIDGAGSGKAKEDGCAV